MSKLNTEIHYFNFNNLDESVEKFSEILEIVTQNYEKKFYIGVTKYYNKRFAQHCDKFGDDEIENMFVVTSSKKATL